MILVIFIIMAVFAGLFRGGRFSRLVALPLKFGWLVLLSFILQVLLFSTPVPVFLGVEGLIPHLYILSLLLVIIAVVANRNLPGIRILGIGLLCNFLVIAVNGGLMPTSTEQMEKEGLVKQAQALRSATRISHIFAANEDTKLSFLGDVFVSPGFLPFRSTFSIGDVFIGVGAFRLVYAGMFYRRRYTFRLG